MSGNEPDSRRVVISRQPVLDLSHLTAPGQLTAIERIEHVAAAIVPESLAAAYAAIPASSVAATIYVPAGTNVRVQTGMLSVGGDGIGAADDMLIVIGMLVITSPVTGPVPRRIHVVGSVLAPRGSEQVLGQVLAGSGAVSYYTYAEGQDIKVLSGQSRLSPAMLANPAGSPDDILIVAGQALVTGEPARVGYRTAIIAGQLAAPAASRDVLEPAVRVQGQVAWYKGAEPRVFNGDASLGADFFRLLREPATVVVFGDLAIGDGVTEDMLLEKLTSLTVFGDAVAPAALVGAVQVIAADVFGDIRASGEPESAGGPDS